MKKLLIPALSLCLSIPFAIAAETTSTAKNTAKSLSKTIPVAKTAPEEVKQAAKKQDETNKALEQAALKQAKEREAKRLEWQKNTRANGAIQEQDIKEKNKAKEKKLREEDQAHLQAHKNKVEEDIAKRKAASQPRKGKVKPIKQTEKP